MDIIADYMTVYVITACYNFIDKLNKYVGSFNASLNKWKCNITDINFQFMFICDEPGMESRLESYVSKLKSDRVKVSIMNNSQNIGATRSRNIGVRELFNNVEISSKMNFKDDFITYFDSDDIWDIDSVKVLSNLRNYKNDFIFLPVDVSTIPINSKCIGDMELGKFCTYVPLQECNYCWRLPYAHQFISQFGFLWYEDDSDSKYFPEDMMFYLNPEHHCYVTGDVICHRNYDTGNIAHDWKGTILKNKSAFRTLAEFHKKNMKKYDYPTELVDYVNYLNYLVHEDSDNR